jgi:tetratricopeptide (TPR) repeat protein
LGLAKKIKKSMEHSLAFDPENLDALESLVQFHIQAPGIAGGDKGEAKILVAKIAKLDALKGHIIGASLAAIEEDYAQAFTHLDQALILSPDNTDIYMGMAGITVAQEKYAEAIPLFEHCLQVEPDNFNCRYQLGKAAQIGDIEDEKAIAAFQAVIASKPDDVSYTAYSYYRMGNVYKQNGDIAAAKKNYQLALKADDIKPARKALKTLGK